VSKGTGWKIYTQQQDIGEIQVVVPTRDLIEHTLDNQCICGPDQEMLVDDDDVPYGVWICHHSLDGREFDE